MLELTRENFRNGKLVIKEEKTDKLQYREIAPNVYSYIVEYVIMEKGLEKDDKLVKIGARAVQKQLKIIVD